MCTKVRKRKVTSVRNSEDQGPKVAFLRSTQTKRSTKNQRKSAIPEVNAIATPAKPPTGKGKGNAAKSNFKKSKSGISVANKTACHLVDEDDTSLTPQFPPYPDPYYLDHTVAIPSNQGTSSGVPRATRKFAKSATPIPPNAATSKVQSLKVTRKPPMMPRKVTPMPTRIFSSPGPSMYSQLQ
ncbi:hypothetical protein BUALT_Bualt14G0053400 [Buddleja alternifolia]|uniref:Uncharacterized protein n=1 Tax=Buddleja alternifolia TaxID=168488 RepID=A0AAV6WIA6_9LAMI|nr:hypothetical protein BUALT_Bualt14G0053400 [Buddleja alternifolia]